MHADPSPGPAPIRLPVSQGNEGPPVLSCRGFGVAFGPREIFTSLEFELVPGSVSIVEGPDGAGRSTLLRTLAGLSQQNSRFRCWGEASYLGRPLGEAGAYPWLVRQDARLMQVPVLEALLEALRAHPRRRHGLNRECVEQELAALGAEVLAEHLSSRSIELPTVLQRAVPLVAAALRGAPLVLLDEPTTRLDEKDVAFILALIGSMARSCTVMAIVPDARHAERIATHRIEMRAPPRAGMPAADIAAGSPSLARPAPLDRPAGTIAPEPAAARPPRAEVPAPAAEPEAVPPEAPSAPAPAPAPETVPSESPPPALASVPSEPAAPIPAPASPSRPADTTAVPPDAVPKVGRDLSGGRGLALVARLLDGPAPEPRGPVGFSWIVRHRLAGTALPLDEAGLDAALAALARTGVTRLITLTEQDLPLRALARHGLANLHLPVRAGEPPSVAQANMLLIRMQGMLDRGEVLAVHCSDGVGRSGTVLAAWLIREGGRAADDALARLRRIDPRFVQSGAQEAFLHHYENSFLKN